MAHTRQKVLFLITKATWGGAQRYVYDLARSLPQNEFQAALAYGVEGRLAELLKNEGVRLRQIPALARDIALFSDIKSFLAIRQMLASAQPQILHLNSSKAAAFGALAGRLENIPKIVFTVHGWPFKESRNPLARALIYFISWLTALMSHEVIVVSRTDERIGKRMWLVRRKVSYIPLGIEVPHFRMPQDAFREMFGEHQSPPLTPETLRLVSIAELTKNKGLRYAIEAVALLKARGRDTIYVIAGVGEEQTALRRLARERGVADCVFFSGFIEHAAINLSGFDMFLLPSLKEGMPYVILEAAAAGLPIVATDAIDAELSREIDSLTIIPSGNALALADAIEGLANRARKQNPDGAFFLTDMVQRTLELYRA